MRDVDNQRQLSYINLAITLKCARFALLVFYIDEIRCRVGKEIVIQNLRLALVRAQNDTLYSSRVAVARDFIQQFVFISKFCTQRLRNILPTTVAAVLVGKPLLSDASASFRFKTKKSIPAAVRLY